MNRMVFAVPGMSWDEVERNCTEALQLLAPECLKSAQAVPIDKIIQFRLGSIENEDVLFFPEELPYGVEGKTDWNPSRQRYEISLDDKVYYKMLAGEGRSRMTAAHEVAHFVLHRETIRYIRETNQEARRMYRSGFYRSSREIPPWQNSERQAEVFAGRFLVPKQPALLAFQNHDLIDARSVEEMFLVSEGAARVRLRELRVHR